METTTSIRRDRAVCRSYRLWVIALIADDHRVGQLIVIGADLDPSRQLLLATFANQAALAIERATLQAEATRATVLEEVDRLRSALMGSVSHDLRTPLASIKASVSDLLDCDLAFDDADRRLLLSTIDTQTDRLNRLVANLLDMSRIEAGALEPKYQIIALSDLLDDADSRLARAPCPLDRPANPR